MRDTHELGMHRKVTFDDDHVIIQNTYNKWEVILTRYDIQRLFQELIRREDTAKLLMEAFEDEQRNP